MKQIAKILTVIVLLLAFSLSTGAHFYVFPSFQNYEEYLEKLEKHRDSLPESFVPLETYMALGFGPIDYGQFAPWVIATKETPSELADHGFHNFRYRFDSGIEVSSIHVYPEFEHSEDVVQYNMWYYYLYSVDEKKDYLEKYYEWKYPYKHIPYDSAMYEGTDLKKLKEGVDPKDGIYFNKQLMYRYDSDGELSRIEIAYADRWITISCWEADLEDVEDIEALAPFLDARTAAQAVDNFADLIANPPSPVKEAGWERWLLPSLGGIAVVALIVIIPLFVRRRKKPTA